MKDMQIGIYQPEDDDDLISSKMKGNTMKDDGMPLIPKLLMAAGALFAIYFVYRAATQE